MVSSRVPDLDLRGTAAASNAVAGELLVQAINDAVAGLDFELAAREVKAGWCSRWPVGHRPVPGCLNSGLTDSFAVPAMASLTFSKEEDP